MYTHDNYIAFLSRHQLAKVGAATFGGKGGSCLPKWKPRYKLFYWEILCVSAEMRQAGAIAGVFYHDKCECTPYRVGKPALHKHSRGQKMSVLLRLFDLYYTVCLCNCSGSVFESALRARLLLNVF